VEEQATVASVELVGLAPQAALDDLPPGRFRSIEEALGCGGGHVTDEEEAPA
jgi:hypothetical protein